MSDNRVMRPAHRRDTDAVTADVRGNGVGGRLQGARLLLFDSTWTDDRRIARVLYAGKGYSQVGHVPAFWPTAWIG